MSIVLIIAFIALLSFVLAVRSLKHLRKIEGVTEAKDELKKGKVIFHNDSVSSSATESSSSSPSA